MSTDLVAAYAQLARHHAEDHRGWMESRKSVCAQRDDAAAKLAAAEVSIRAALSLLDAGGTKEAVELLSDVLAGYAVTAAPRTGEYEYDTTIRRGVR